MRTLFWILLLGNAILFAVMRQGGANWGEQPYQPQPPLNEDKIRLVAAPTKPASSNAAPRNEVPPNAIPQNAIPQSATPQSATPQSATPQSATPQKSGPQKPQTTTPPAQQNPAVRPPVVEAPVERPGGELKTAASKRATSFTSNPAANAGSKQAASVCLEWGDFSGIDLKRATGFLSTLQLGEKLSERQIQYDKGYWAYIPPLKSKSAANRKVDQLKKLGIKEYFIVQDAGAFRYAISLGVFKTQEAAQNYLKELRAKGLKNAKVGERASKLKTTMFLLHDTDKSVAAKLAAAKKDFPGSEVKNVPCALTK